MPHDIKSRIVLEGEQEYRAAMRDAASANKTLASEMKLAKAQFDATGDSQQYAADQARILKEQIQNQKRAVEAAEKAIRDLTELGVDKNADQVQKWRTKLNNAKTSLVNMESQLNKVGTELGEEQTEFGNTETAAQNFGDKMDQVSKAVTMQAAIEAIDRVTAQIENVIKTAAKAAKYFWEMGVDAGAWADNIAAAANYAGVDPATYQSWMYASRFIDTSVDDIIKNWRDIDNKLNQSGDAFYEYAGGLAEMGIAVKDASGNMRQGSDIFWEVIDYLHGISDESTRTAKAIELFGNDWRKLNPLITAGSEAYKAMAEEGMSVAVVSNESVEALGGMDDKMQKLSAQFDKFKYDSLAALAPTFSSVADSLSLAIDAMNEFVQSEEGQAALAGLNEALSGLITSFLGEDGGKGTFESIVNGAKDAVTGFTGAMDWISQNGATVTGIIAGMGGAWATLKVTGSVLTFLQLLQGVDLDKLKTIFSPKSASAAPQGAATPPTVKPTPGKTVPAVTPESAGLPALLGSGAALVGAEAFFLESSKRIVQDNKEMKDAVIAANEEVAAAAANTHAQVENNMGKETADLRDQLVESATEALRLVEDRSSQAAPGIGMYAPTVGVNRSALMNAAEELQKSADQLEGLLSESTMNRLKDANIRGGFMGIGSMGDQQLWDLVNDVTQELANQTGEAEKDAEKMAFTFADAAAEAASAMTEAAEQMGMTEKEYSQMEAAQKYWDNIRTNGLVGNSAVIAGGEFHSAFIGEEAKFATLTTRIRDFISAAGSDWTQIEDLPEEWFTVGSDAVNQLSSAMEEASPAASEAAAATADAAAGAVEGLQGDMEVYGENAAVGLANGIDRRADEAVSAARFMAGAVADIVRTTLMIRSPSRVMEGLGEYTGQGFALGIESSATDVDRAVGKMLSATTRRPALSYAGAAVSVSPRSMGGSSAAAADADAQGTVHVTLMLDGEAVGEVMAPIVNQKIGAKIQATRR